MSRHFPKEDSQVENKHMERYTSSLVIRQMEIKTAMRYLYIPIRWD